MIQKIYYVKKKRLRKILWKIKLHVTEEDKQKKNVRKPIDQKETKKKKKKVEKNLK